MTTESFMHRFMSRLETISFTEKSLHHEGQSTTIVRPRMAWGGIARAKTGLEPELDLDQAPPHNV